MKKTSTPNTPSRLYRSTTNRMLGGVAGGIGEYFDIDPNFIRIGFVLLTLLNGIGLILYILMWIFLPTDTQTSQDNEQTVKANMREMKEKVQSFGHSLGMNNKKSPSENSRFWWAVLIIALGFFFLFRNFGLFDALDLGRLWPIILIVLGLLFIIKK